MADQHEQKTRSGGLQKPGVRFVSWPTATVGLAIVAVALIVVLRPILPLGAGEQPSPSPGVSTTDSPSASPAPTGASPEPLGSSGSLPGAFADALTDWAWVTQAGDEWLAGLGTRARLRLRLEDGHALADWGQVGLIRRAGDGLRAGVVDWMTATVRDYPVPFASRTTSARPARAGDRLVVHGGADGLDEGVAVLDPATGRLEQLVAPVPLADGFVRNLIFWSPSGRTLVSTICDFERCLVDVVDVESRRVRRLEEPFPALAATDRYLVGRTWQGSPWEVLDLERGERRILELDPQIQASVISTVDGEQLVVDSAEAGRYRILQVDLAAGTVRTVYDAPARGDADVRLLVGGPRDGRWLVLAPGGSFEWSLQATGRLPELWGLALATGQLAGDRVQLTDESAGQ